MTLSKKQPKAGRSKLAKARKQLTPAELFFYEHAGYSYDPKTETVEQGRIRGAKELAAAEQFGREHHWQFVWNDDWSVGSHKEFYGEGSAYEEREPDTCESCTLWAQEDPLASLGCIDDASREYRRVVEAELASEAMAKAKREEDQFREAIQHMN